MRQQECLDYLSKHLPNFSPDDLPSTKLVNFFGEMTSLDTDAETPLTVKNFVLKYHRSEPLLKDPVFVKKLIEFGVLKKYIKRLMAYVISTYSPYTSKF